MYIYYICMYGAEGMFLSLCESVHCCITSFLLVDSSLPIHPSPLIKGATDFSNIAHYLSNIFLP